MFEHPNFISYFTHATPEAELGNLNIGSRCGRPGARGGGGSGAAAGPQQASEQTHAHRSAAAVSKLQLQATSKHAGTGK